MFTKLKRLQRPNIAATFGPAFTLPAFTAGNRAEQLKKGTDEIMCRIAVLLPEKYRGVYADNPRLKELEKNAISTDGQAI